MNKLTLNKLILAIGIFLVFDGLLSIYYGNKCLAMCLNNNDFGNVIRAMRFLLGCVLVYLSAKNS